MDATRYEIRTFLAGYAEAIAWANTYEARTDDYGDALGAWVETDAGKFYAVTETAHAVIDTGDAIEFLTDNLATLRDVSETFGVDMGQHGHDFALTRNGHGAGFWDRGYGDVGDELSDAARVYGEHNVRLGE